MVSPPTWAVVQSNCEPKQTLLQVALLKYLSIATRKITDTHSFNTGVSQSYIKPLSNLVPTVTPRELSLQTSPLSSFLTPWPRSLQCLRLLPCNAQPCPLCLPATGRDLDPGLQVSQAHFLFPSYAVPCPLALSEHLWRAPGSVLLGGQVMIKYTATRLSSVTAI